MRRGRSGAGRTRWRPRRNARRCPSRRTARELTFEDTQDSRSDEHPITFPARRLFENPSLRELGYGQLRGPRRHVEQPRRERDGRRRSAEEMVDEAQRKARGAGGFELPAIRLAEIEE